MNDFLDEHFVVIPVGFDGKAGKAKPLFDGDDHDLDERGRCRHHPVFHVKKEDPDV